MKMIILISLTISVSLSARANSVVASARSTLASAKGQLEGPGRSGGGNGVFNEAKNNSRILDAVESAETKLIKNWTTEVASFKALQKRLSPFPDLQAYLLDVLDAKNWYWTTASLDVESCYNSSLLKSRKGLQVVACQWQDHGVISKQRFEQLSTADQQQLLIHEGLIHHMVQTLNRLDQQLSRSEVDRRQQTMELGIHQLSTEIFQGHFKKTLDLNRSLRSLGLPMLLTDADKQKAIKLDKGALPIDLYAGGREKTELMRVRFETSSPVRLSALQKQFGKEACFFQKDGYNVPGYFASGYLKLDEFFPSAIFSVFPFREIQASEDMLKQGLKHMYSQGAGLIPLQYQAGNLTGLVEVNLETIFKQMFGEAPDAVTRDEAREIILKQLPGADIDKPRRTKLEIRSLGPITPEGQYIIFKREIFISDGNKFISSGADYIAGELKSYPNCLD